MTDSLKRIMALVAQTISQSPNFLFMGAPKKKTMEAREMNKENGPAKVNLVPINTPLLLTNCTWSFRHFSRYLSRPMLKLQRELLFLIDSRKR